MSLFGRAIEFRRYQFCGARLGVSAGPVLGWWYRSQRRRIRFSEAPASVSRQAMADFGVSAESFGSSAVDRLLASAGGEFRPLSMVVRNTLRRRWPLRADRGHAGRKWSVLYVGAECAGVTDTDAGRFVRSNGTTCG